MGRRSHLHVSNQPGHVSAVLETPGASQRRLSYWSLDEVAPFGYDDRGDSQLVGSLLLFMAAGADLTVHGTVSRRLLTNLEEMQAVWAKWSPKQYPRIAIDADNVVADEPRGEGAISAYSGGVDATFNLHRHLHGLVRWPAAPLRAAMLVHGFDIPTHQRQTFERARERARHALTDTGLSLHVVRTDLRALPQSWHDVCGTAVSSCLLLFADSYRVGLIGSTEDYSAMVLPWGSTPVQDWMASTGRMEIRHEGAGFSRSEKIAALGDWPEALDQLRVCWAGNNLDRNCGKCEKCIRTQLNFRAVGLPVPASFPATADDDQIRTTYLANTTMAGEFQSIVNIARANGIHDSWVAAADEAIARSEMARGRPANRLFHDLTWRAHSGWARYVRR